MPPTPKHSANAMCDKEFCVNLSPYCFLHVLNFRFSQNILCCWFPALKYLQSIATQGNGDCSWPIFWQAGLKVNKINKFYVSIFLNKWQDFYAKYSKTNEFCSLGYKCCLHFPNIIKIFVSHIMGLSFLKFHLNVDGFFSEHLFHMNWMTFLCINIPQRYALV